MPTVGSIYPDDTGSRRLQWDVLPQRVVAGIERSLGSTVARALDQPGGFSEGVAARVRLANGGRAFMKAANAAAAPAAAGFHRREIAVARALPARAPVSRLIGDYDDGEWVALIFEEIDGRLPVQPWSPVEFDRVVRAITELGPALTPSPIDSTLLGRPRLGGWIEMTDGRGIGRIAERAPWAADHLDELAALESQADDVLAGETLQHGDLYPFNILVNDSGAVVIDWPHAWVGAPHCDLVAFLSSASLGGIDPEPVIALSPLTRDLAPHMIDVVLALQSGFLLRIAAGAGPTADPKLVEMMTALAMASLRWLRRRML